MPPPRVLLVLPTHSYRADAFLNAARRQQMEIVVASESPSTLSRLMPGRELVLDLRSTGDAVEQAVAFAVTHPIDGVVGVDESAVLTAAHIADALGLRHHSLAGTIAARDKRLLRARLADAGLPQPAFTEVRPDSEPAGLAAAVAGGGGYPVVVKPVDLSAAQGVIRCDDPAGLASAVTRIGRMLDGMGCAPTGAQPLLLERFIPGGEVCVEVLVRDGEVHVLAVFDKPDPMDGPFFDETILVTPSRRPPATQAAITAYTVSACRALGLDHGPAHVELRIPPAGPVLIEVAARSIGGQCSRTLSFGDDDLSLEELILRNACGLPVDDLRPRHLAAAALMLPIPRAGRLLRVEGIDEARAVPGVDSVSITVPEGAGIVPLPEGDRYLGFVIAHAAGPLEAEVAVRRAQQAIRVVIA
jgi:biotin carboxylase